MLLMWVIWLWDGNGAFLRGVSLGLPSFYKLLCCFEKSPCIFSGIQKEMWIFYLRVILLSRPSVVSCSVTLQPQCLQYFCSHPECAQGLFEGSSWRGNICFGRNMYFPNKFLSLILRLPNNYFLSHLPTHTSSVPCSIPAWIYFLWKRERERETFQVQEYCLGNWYICS